MNFVRETEQALLALMLDSDCRSKARQTVQPRWLYETPHRHLLEAAFAWDLDHDTELTVHGWASLYARNSGLSLNDAGLAITEALFASGAPKNLPAYAELVREDWERREIGRVGSAVSEGSKDPSRSPLDLARQATSVAEIVRERQSEAVTGEEALAAAAMRSDTGTVHTGFRDLDRVLGGMKPGNVTTVGGRPSMGKTAFAVDVMRSACANGKRVGFVTLEMEAAELYARLIRIPFVSDYQPLFWYPKRRPTTDTIAAQAMNWAADGLDLLIIDYLGLIAHPNPRSGLYERTTENMHNMKPLARTLKAPVLLLAQLHREGAGDRFPTMADFRDSGAVEEDSDAVILLHRPGYYDRAKDSSEAWAILAKNRHGRTDMVRIHWDREQVAYLNHAPFPGVDPGARTEV